MSGVSYRYSVKTSVELVNVTSAVITAVLAGRTRVKKPVMNGMNVLTMFVVVNIVISMLC